MPTNIHTSNHDVHSKMFKSGVTASYKTAIALTKNIRLTSSTEPSLCFVQII